MIFAGVLAYEYYESEYWRDQTVLVELSVEYNEDECGPKRPLRVYAANNSSYIVDKIEWDIAIFNKGYSSNIAARSYHAYAHDKILENSESWRYCFPIPKIEGLISVESFDNIEGMNSRLLYKVKNKHVVFNKSA